MLFRSVKTSILLIDRTLAKQTDSILFVKLSNDGFDLGAQRNQIDGSEIPQIIDVVNNYKKGVLNTSLSNVVIANKVDIVNEDYVLIGDRYIKEIEYEGLYPLVNLGDSSLFRIESGGTPDTKNPAFCPERPLRPSPRPRLSHVPESPEASPKDCDPGMY